MMIELNFANGATYKTSEHISMQLVQTLTQINGHVVVPDNKEAVWKFSWDCQKMGDITALFVATNQQIADLIGKHVHFGEILGKHSEISGTVKRTDLTEITRNPKLLTSSNTKT